MEELKKQRSSKGGTVTRRINELNMALKHELDEEDLNEMISKLKIATEELGVTQDALTLEINGDEKALEEAEMWYYGYVNRANSVLRNARKSIVKPYEKVSVPSVCSNVKVKKLEVPTFNSSHKSYYKWKATFERYMFGVDADTKYDYLLSCTQGMANEYVANKSTYQEAILKLDNVFGNVHEIIRILLDEIRRIPPIKEFDFQAFEQFSFQVNNFRDRLIEMELINEVENKYVLNEIERKLCNNDLHKWLDSLDDDIDARKVETLVAWLEKQTRLRRIIQRTPYEGTATPKFTTQTGKNMLYHEFPGKFKKTVPSFMMNPSGINSVAVCVLCNTTHACITECQILPLLPLNEKWNFVKANSMCFICLENGHQRPTCTANKCEICQGPHHKWLHNPRRRPQTANFINNNMSTTPTVELPSHVNNSVTISAGNLNQEFPPQYSNELYENNCNPTRCFLPVVTSTLKSGDREYNAMTLLDSGSEINVITNRCYEKLKLVGTPITVRITGAGGIVTKRTTKLVDVSIIDKNGSQTQVECIVLNEACGRVISIGTDVIALVKEQFNVRVENLVKEEGKIDILIGMTSPQLHRQLSLQGEPNNLHIIQTLFGPCLVGPVPKGQKGNYELGHILTNSINIDIDENEKLEKFLEAELAGIKKECACQTKSDDELKFEEAMTSSWTTAEDGRLQIQLPWKLEPQKLANNREQAISRDIKLKKYLEKNENTLKLFQDQINEMIAGGILRKVDSNYPKRYLPLLAVVDLERDSTKVRICLDSKTKYKGVSINDALLKGKLEMLDIFQGITRFRVGKYALMGDVKKMFWQIRLSEADEKYHGVIWNGNTFTFTRVCFGDINSPPIADFSMKKVATSGRDNYPLAYDVLMNKRYMDDILDASSNAEEIISIRDETSKLLGKYGFEIKKWYSNHSEIGVVANDQKVLGMRWEMIKDELSLSITASKCKKADLNNFTKREVLSRIASIWDPLGICSGYVLKGRLIFQSIVRLKSKWDDSILDPDLFKKWNSWLEQLSLCEGLLIGRSILPDNIIVSNSGCEIIGFSDGSSNAFGCVLYIRWINEDESEIEIKFLGAKGKVGPIGGNTVPRQELCGALILSRLTNSMMNALQHTELENTVKDTKLFTDSTTVLRWINSEAFRYRPYVKNKVIEIQDLQPVKNWSYIRSRDNKAADLISKGCNVKELEIVLEGPQILRERSSNWEKLGASTEVEDERDPEELACNVTAIDPKGTTKKEVPIEVSRYKSFRKLKRVTAFVFRWRNKIKASSPCDRGTIPALTEDELQKAETFWIKKAQEYLQDLPPSDTQKLAAFKDQEGIWRIHGRLKNSKIFDIGRVHPILLHYKDAISELIVNDVHESVYHPGHLRVIAECRKTYWIIGILKLAKSLGYRCVTCRRWRRACLEQFMADLPEFRITPGAPFENCSIDYFGPLTIRFGRRQRTKGYGALFSCLTTRAIHVELVTDLTIDRFLMALRRFISLYGQPKFIRSDNGSNFRGAASELRRMFRQWKSEKLGSDLLTFCDKYTINWTFSTPTASHHNGAVEAMVKSVKNALNKVIANKVLTEEEFRTVLSEVTACVNSRPLWPPTEGDLHQPPITCNDMLKPGGLDRNPETMNLSCNPRKRYAHIQQAMDEWWKCWMDHFTPNLQIRSKWYKKRENLSTGDVVLLMDKMLPRGQWKLGIVEDIFPNNDGLVRSVKVRTSDGSYNRPITKLTLLLAKGEVEED